MSVGKWTKETEERVKACLRDRISPTRTDAQAMLDEIERLQGEIERLTTTKSADALDSKLRRHEGGSYAGMLDRS